MRLPAYRYVTIKKESFAQKLKSIKKFEYFENPIVFDLTFMTTTTQDEILTDLIIKLKKLKLTQIPYQIYILTLSSLRFEGYNILQSEKELPIFHKKKEKSLNVREASLLNKIKLKQRKLSQIDAYYYDDAIKDYASYQRKVKSRQGFLNFLSEIKDLK